MNLSDQKIAVVIPAKNEPQSIRAVIEGVRRWGADIYIVCDDERDPTLDAARQAGVRVLVNTDARGKGRAIRFAVQQIQCDIFVFMDADGSHNSEDFPKLVAPILEGRADLVLGSRMAGGSEELSNGLDQRLRLWANEFSAAFVNRFFRIQLTDVNDGFRAIRAQTAKGLELREPRFAIEIEMILECARQGKRIEEIPTREFRRTHGVSRLNLLIQLLDCIRCFVRYLLIKIR